MNANELTPGPAANAAADFNRFLFTARYAAVRAAKGLPPMSDNLDNLPAPARNTAHGVPMSERMSRLHTFLDSQKISIRDFSTDQDVLRELPKLNAAIERVAEANARATSPVRQALLDDLRGLARRVPANRVQANGAVNAAPEASAKRTHSIVEEQGVVAVAKATESTGAVVYWRLRGDVARARLEHHAGTLEAKELPALPSNDVALSRAAKELAARSVLVRKHPAGGWGIVRESVAGATLNYETTARAFLGFDGEVQYEGDSTDGGKIAAEYAKARASLSTLDMSVWLVKLARQIGAVSLRENGGIYFVPAGASLDKLHAVKAMLHAASGHIVEEIPAVRSEETIGAVLNALAIEIDAEIVTMDNEANEPTGMGKTVKANRKREIDELKTKVEKYAKLLGKNLAPMLDKLTVLQKKIANLATRTNQIEVD